MCSSMNYVYVMNASCRLAHSAGIRINARGLRFIPLSHTLHFATENALDYTPSDENTRLDSSTLVSETQWKTITLSTATNRWRSVQCIPARLVGLTPQASRYKLPCILQ
jgi:hypothetical protein